MMNVSKVTCALTGFLLWVGVSASAWSIGITGTVSSVAGTPLAGVLVTAESDSSAAFATTVYSDRDGRFSIPDLGINVGANSIRIACHKLGYTQSAPKASQLVDILKDQPPTTATGSTVVNCLMAPVENIAEQVPPAAWLAKIPESEPNRRLVVWACSNCHQFPSGRVKPFAASLAGLTETDRTAAWHAMATSMGALVSRVLTVEHSAGGVVSADPYATFISKQDVEIISPLIAKYLGTSFESLPATKFSRAKGLETSATVVQEYPWSGATSMVREVITSTRSPYVWGIDIQRNRLLRLDPSTGAQRWVDLPGVGAYAPHTLIPSKDGSIWVTLIEINGGLGTFKFDPVTERFQGFMGFPKGVAMHDFAGSTGYWADFDNRGFGWLTDIASNKLVGFNPGTGNVVTQSLPMLKNETPTHSAVYGAAMTSDKHVWFTQLRGYIGEFNTDKRTIGELIEMPAGSGPRRLAVDENDVIYVPLFGDGAIYVYDTRKHRHLGTYPLPDRNAAPYAVAWDPHRKKLWVANTNMNSLYIFDPNSKEFRELELPRKGIYFRQIAIDSKTADLWITYSSTPTDTTMIARIHPGDMPTH